MTLAFLLTYNLFLGIDFNQLFLQNLVQRGICIRNRSWTHEDVKSANWGRELFYKKVNNIVHAVGNLWCIVSTRIIVLGRLLSAAISSLICEVRPYGIGRFCRLLKLGFWAILHISLQLFFVDFYYLWQPVCGVVHTCTYMGITWLHTQQYSLKSPFNNERIGAIRIMVGLFTGPQPFLPSNLKARQQIHCHCRAKEAEIIRSLPDTLKSVRKTTKLSKTVRTFATLSVTDA